MEKGRVIFMERIGQYESMLGKVTATDSHLIIENTAGTVYWIPWWNVSYVLKEK